MMKLIWPKRDAARWAASQRTSGVPQRNLAFQRPASQSSISAWSAHKTPEKDARGANNGVKNGGQGFHTGREPFAWWQVDLGGTCRIDTILLHNRRNNPERLRHFSILASLDGARWVEFFRKADNGVFDADAPYSAKLPAGSVARFVRIQNNSAEYLHFCECEVFGEMAAAEDCGSLEASFQDRVAIEEKRMCAPLPPHGPKELDLELALTQGLFPFPEAELARTDAREWILNYMPKGAIGAEIGVFRGHFSELILRRTAPKKLYLVDPWRKIGEMFYFGGNYTNEKRLPTALARRDTELRVRKFPNTKTILVEDYFPKCASMITEPLDWIYIDSSHAYEQTLLELFESAKIIKPGGRILGDDFWPITTNPHQHVARAVNEFVKRQPFEFLAAGPHGQWALRHVGA